MTLCDWSKLPALLSSFSKRLTDLLETRQNDRYLTVQEYMAFLSLDLDDDRVVCHGKMLAIALALQSERNISLEYYAEAVKELEAINKQDKAQAEFWQDHAQALTQQVRDLQVALDRRSK